MSGQEPRSAIRRTQSLTEPAPLETLEIDGHKADLSREALTILARHHIGIEEKAASILLRFPEGTTIQEIWPRTAGERHRIVLPNGYELRYHCDRHLLRGNRRIILLKPEE
ncbi:MAG TPA: hypothetical protein VKV37_10445 [Ktedonobacteraceae bacterium]|jgi:hypothetical protein|nr:hypothetical protein [Ktedonobacteraceae bacterium]